MQLTLDATDLAKLSPDARAEIFRLLGFTDDQRELMTRIAPLTPTTAFQPQASPTYSETDERGLINLTPALADQLIKGINTKSREYLRWLSESPDEEMELLFPENPKYKDFSSFKREFIGPINRRLRTITNNRKAELFFIYKDSEDSTYRQQPRLVGEDLTFSSEGPNGEFTIGGPDEGFVYVSKQTAASLRVVLKTRVMELPPNTTE
jgi:hypothetical protein